MCLAYLFVACTQACLGMHSKAAAHVCSTTFDAFLDVPGVETGSRTTFNVSGECVPIWHSQPPCPDSSVLLEDERKATRFDRVVLLQRGLQLRPDHVLPGVCVQWCRYHRRCKRLHVEGRCLQHSASAASRADEKGDDQQIGLLQAVRDALSISERTTEGLVFSADNDNALSLFPLGGARPQLRQRSDRVALRQAHTQRCESRARRDSAEPRVLCF
mmetsp:Transcript_7757/g.15220  ORF Transcript_7757/g.15220 Transcript_7757/m.15220 type:complete len:216 (-) Transcript_7757:578-1225(-)